jgi:glycosyltransferase involved in cell wall biosynthesis
MTRQSRLDAIDGSEVPEGFEAVRYAHDALLISGTARAGRATDCRRRVALVTPWQTVCGNARYAEKLAAGLETFVDLAPVALAPGPFAKGYFDSIAAEIRCSRADVVHIQHEYCFFGDLLSDSNRQLNRLLAKIEAPVVLTLHTVRADLLATRSLRGPLRQWWYDGFTNLLEKLRFRGTGMLRRFTHRKTRRSDSFFRALSHCAIIVVHSHISAQYLAQAHPELAAKIEVVPIAVPAPAALQQPVVVKPSDEVWLMMLGFVSEYKGHLAAIEALSLLPSNYRLVVAGGRHPNDANALNYWTRLLTAIDALQLRDRVTFTGFIGDDGQYAATLAQADAFLLPYKEVGQSASAVLADVMSFGKPVVTSTARSMFEYRYDRDSLQSAFAADVEDAAAFAAQIEFALEQSRNPSATFKQHVAHARQSCSLESVASRHVQVYEKAEGA